MDVRLGIILIVFGSILVVPVMADTGYFVHCNIDGARVVVGDEVIGEIQDHECWVPWDSESNKEHLTIAADGYREIWDTLVQPWPDVPEHLYYRMKPTDPTVSGTDGDVRVLVQPAALNYVYIRDRSPGADDNWEFAGDWYGTEFTLHYLPMGQKEIMIKRTNFVDVSQEVYVIPNWETDIAFEMVRTEEPEPLDAAASVDYNQPEKSVQRQQSILVVETPTPAEPVVQVITAQTIEDTATQTDEIPEEEKPFNTLGALILVCFVGMFIGVGWYIFNRIQLV